MKPILLLDIDGVLAPFGPAEGYHWEPDAEMFHNPANASYLETLARVYSLHWASAREHESNVIGPLLRLPFLPFLRFGTTREHGRIVLPSSAHLRQGQSWKLPWIAEFADDHQVPLVWIDDDAHDDAVKWAKHREPSTRIIRPDAYQGLQPEHAEELMEFAMSVAT